jgi:hypothetical protein
MPITQNGLEYTCGTAMCDQIDVSNKLEYIPYKS